MTDFLQRAQERFPYLTEEKFIQLFSMGDLLMLKSGEVFIRAGERKKTGCIVLQGLLRNYVTDHKNEQVTVVFAAEMQPIAPYRTVFLNEPATETTEAVEDSVLFVFDLARFKELGETDPVINRMYIDIIESLFLAAVERVESFAKRKPEQRYRHLLDTQGYLAERVPLKYLASYLGITSVSLSRIRKRLSRSAN